MFVPFTNRLRRTAPSVPELNDVTVEQALDYVLQTFPGFWFYQNRHDPHGRRKISVGFVSINSPVSG